jgi:hypothetical protein
MNNRRPYKLTPSVAKKLLPEAINVAESVKVDQLDCSVSWRRQPTDKTIEEVLALGLSNPDTIYSFIYRDQSFLPQEYPENCDYWDVGFRTDTPQAEYFLWIRLHIKSGEELVKKYDLERI